MDLPFARVWNGLGSRKEVLLFYGLAPLISSPLLLTAEYESGDPTRIVRSIAALYLPFVLIPLAITAVFQNLLPRLRRGSGRPPSTGLSLLIMTGTPLAVSAAIKPFFDALSGQTTAWIPWLTAGVVITWTSSLPILVIARVKEDSERALLAERHTALRAQLQALQARTNPHFLFNSLNSVAELIHPDPELAERTVERVAELLRYALSSAEQSVVPLSRELEVVQQYVEIERARFGDRLRFLMEIDPATLDAKLPPLTLQTLVENAVLHGAQARRGGVTVEVKARLADGTLDLCVQDDGPGPGGSSHRGNGLGLVELGRRIALLFGPEGGLTTGERPGGGFQARVLAPQRREAP